MVDTPFPDPLTAGHSVVAEARRVGRCPLLDKELPRSHGPFFLLTSSAFMSTSLDDGPDALRPYVIDLDCGKPMLDQTITLQLVVFCAPRVPVLSRHCSRPRWSPRIDTVPRDFGDLIARCPETIKIRASQKNDPEIAISDGICEPKLAIFCHAAMPYVNL